MGGGGRGGGGVVGGGDVGEGEGVVGGDGGVVEGDGRGGGGVVGGGDGRGEEGLWEEKEGGGWVVGGDGRGGGGIVGGDGRVGGDGGGKESDGRRRESGEGERGGGERPDELVRSYKYPRDNTLLKYCHTQIASVCVCAQNDILEQTLISKNIICSTKYVCHQRGRKNPLCLQT